MVGHDAVKGDGEKITQRRRARRGARRICAENSKGALVGGGGGVVGEDGVGCAVRAEDGEGFSVGGPAEVDDLVGLEIGDEAAFGAVDRLQPNIVGAVLQNEDGNALAFGVETHSNCVWSSRVAKNNPAA